MAVWALGLAPIGGTVRAFGVPLSLGLMALNLACAPTLPAASSSAQPAAAVATAPSTPTATAAAPPAPVVVRTGATGAVSDAAFYFAEELGYFRDVGIVNEMPTFRSASDMIPALASGQLDVGSGGPSAGLFNAIGRQVALKIVGDKSTTSATHSSQALVARKDLVDRGEIQGVADLRGRGVGLLGTGVSSHYQLDRALGRVGLSVQDVEISVLPQPEMSSAVANGALDAVIVVEPLLGVGERQGVWVPLVWGDEMVPQQTGAVLMYSPQFVERDVPLGQRFMAAYVRGLRLYYETFVSGVRPRAEVIPILVKHSPIKDAALWERIRGSAIDPDGYPNQQSLADEQDWYYAQGFLPERVDLASVIDRRFADYAVQQLGQYPR